MIDIKRYIILILSIGILYWATSLFVSAYDTNMSPEIFRSYGKQQQKVKDSKGNTTLVTPNYSNYADRNQNVSEKIVAIYDKHAPDGAYGARYVLYTPIGHFVGYHKIMQASPNGYGYSPIWDGGEGSDTPCFYTIDEARHYYYPEWY